MLNDSTAKTAQKWGAMREFVKKHWKTVLFFAAVGLVGGFFVGLYSLESYPEEIKEEAYDQGLNDVLVGIITAIQSAIYGIVLGALGIMLGKRTGLWRDEITLTRKPLIITSAVALIGGSVMILSDLLYFGKYLDAVMASYAVKPTFAYAVATVTYGGVIEEVMLRLFMMSLIAFIIYLPFRRKYEKPTTIMLAAANVIAALLFATGHIPATEILIGLTPMSFFRCFFLNGGLGLLFGWLYRKYGLRYSMLAHAGCHIVSKLIWILFV